MRMTVKTEHPLQDGGAPEYAYRDRTAWRCAVFVGKVMTANDIHKEMLPSTVSIACHVKQSSKTTSFGGNTFLTMTRWNEQCACGSDSNHKNFMAQVSRG